MMRIQSFDRSSNVGAAGMVHRLVRLIRLPLVLGFGLMLAACDGDKHGDLAAYVREVKARAPGKIAPLPKLEPYENYVYLDADLRDPFKPIPGIEPVAQEEAPPPRSQDELLEQYPLDSLRMVGSLEKRGITWGVIKTTDGLVHRVKVGDHMGKNFGEIKEITNAEILLVELIRGPNGNWVERDAKLILNE